MNNLQINQCLIVVPCFNEEHRFDLLSWEQTIRAIPEISWWFIDDGSNDNTFNLLGKLTDHSNVHLLKIENNLGKANAIRVGMIAGLKYVKENSMGIDSIGYIDSDGAFSIADIKNIVMKTHRYFNIGYSVVLSSRIALAGHQIIRKKSRHYLGRLIRTFIAWRWDGAPYDTQCGFKMFSCDNFLQDAIASKFESRWFIDIELIMRLTKGRNSILRMREIPLENWVDKDGSKITVRTYPALIKEIFHIKFLVNRTMRYLRRYSDINH